MNSAINLFSALGEQLASFGKEPESCLVIAQACEANAWFCADDICRAVAALRDEMMQRNKLSVWLSHYSTPVATPQRVLVVAAGNIPLVGFFDLLCVVAAGHCCLIKPSSKDEVLMRYMIDRMWQIDPKTPIAYYKEGDAVDAVIATGSDNTNRYFKTRFEGLPALLRGSRQSVAVLAENQTPEQLRELSDAVFAYSGLGCRSVSLIFVPRGYDFDLQVPMMNPKYRNNYKQARALLEMSGELFRDLTGAILTLGREFPKTLSRINYTPYDSLDEVNAWLEEHDQQVQCVVSQVLPHSRCVDFGVAQSPSLMDYPDQRDVMQFLIEI